MAAVAGDAGGPGRSAAAVDYDSTGRPTALLPLPQLLRLSFYWLGLTAVFNGIGVMLQSRMPDLVPAGYVGSATGVANLAGVAIAVLVQPTVGSISDYTITRFGRRKPYILIGTLLDMVFLVGFATSNTYLAVVAFMVLLQFSSNFAQGPFQGYVPDLVPAPQVGLASSLVGLMQVLGVVVGIGMAGLAIAVDDFVWPTIALGLIEVVTMVVLFIRLDDGRHAKDRGGRSWAEIGREAWGTDILAERSFLFLVASRFFILGGSSILFAIAIRLLERSFGLQGADQTLWLYLTTGCLALFTVLSTVPAGRLSDRVGRKRVIYASCVLGSLGMVLTALAPGPPVALPGAVIVGVGAGTFLAVDWALMTDIIPKASSGRYMGISNVATATNGAVAGFIAGLIIDAFFAAGVPGAGPRVALLTSVAWFATGAVLLRPVDPHRRDEETVGDVGRLALTEEATSA